MSFTDQKPRIATAEDVAGEWGLSGNGFRCNMCGRRFKVGDGWRWVYAAHRGYLNPLVCSACDGDDVSDRWIAHVHDGETRFWWMRQP